MHIYNTHTYTHAHIQHTHIHTCIDDSLHNKGTEMMSLPTAHANFALVQPSTHLKEGGQEEVADTLKEKFRGGWSQDDGGVGGGWMWMDGMGVHMYRYCCVGVLWYNLWFTFCVPFRSEVIT